LLADGYEFFKCVLLFQRSYSMSFRSWGSGLTNTLELLFSMLAENENVLFEIAK